MARARLRAIFVVTCSTRGAAWFAEEVIPAGRKLYSEGDPANRVHFLSTGVIRITCVVDVEHPIDDEAVTMRDGGGARDGKPGRGGRLRSGVGHRKKKPAPGGPIKQLIELEDIVAPRIVGLVDVALGNAKRTHDCTVAGDTAARGWAAPGSIVRCLVLGDDTHEGGRVLRDAASAQARWYGMLREEGREGMRAGAGLLGDLRTQVMNAVADVSTISEDLARKGDSPSAGGGGGGGVGAPGPAQATARPRLTPIDTGGHSAPTPQLVRVGSERRNGVIVPLATGTPRLAGTPSPSASGGGGVAGGGAPNPTLNRLRAEFGARGRTDSTGSVDSIVTPGRGRRPHAGSVVGAAVASPVRLVTELEKTPASTRARVEDALRRGRRRSSVEREV